MAASKQPVIVPDRRFATTLARGLSVLRAFRADDDGLGNAELAARTGLPRSTVSRLTFTLRSLGYLVHVRGDERYRPGPVLLSLGNVAAGAIPFVDAAVPLMQRLADDTDTLAILCVRDGDKVLLVRTWRPRGVASLWLEVGHRIPIAQSASGAALLGALSDDAFAALPDVGDDSVDSGTERNRVGVDDGARASRVAVRRAAGEQLATRGFVVVEPEAYFTPNIQAVSVPFHARQLAEPVAFSCGATPDVLSIERLQDEVGPALRTAVDALAALTGEPGAVPRQPFQEIAS